MVDHDDLLSSLSKHFCLKSELLALPTERVVSLFSQFQIQILSCLVRLICCLATVYSVDLVSHFLLLRQGDLLFFRVIVVLSSKIGASVWHRHTGRQQESEQKKEGQNLNSACCRSLISIKSDVHGRRAAKSNTYSSLSASFSKAVLSSAFLGSSF